MKKKRLVQSFMFIALLGMILTFSGCPYFIGLTIQVNNNTGSSVNAYVEYGNHSESWTYTIAPSDYEIISVDYFFEEEYDHISIVVMDGMDRWRSDGIIGDTAWTIVADYPQDFTRTFP
ncbi:MAG: hypothetical protein JW904_12095 [Spirochaetales bacterium]|nr:hypothetical protein [Spirochaetales bacterium]